MRSHKSQYRSIEKINGIFKGDVRGCGLLKRRFWSKWSLYAPVFLRKIKRVLLKYGNAYVMTKEGKKNTALYRDKYNYILSQREVQNKRGEFETTRSLGREKEQGSFLGRAERAKERNEIVHGYLPKVLASYMKRYQANGISGTFFGAQDRSELS